MNKTKIDWCDRTWNPLTGCFNSCPYCYAAKIANRFGLNFTPKLGDPGMEGARKYDSEAGMDSMLELQHPYISYDGIKNHYPMGFSPTFHKYKLNEPTEITKSKNVFVCSMADLFGDWVPDEWIEQVFAACKKAPQHRYLFLTKNPKRYMELNKKGEAIMPIKNNYWFGTTVTTDSETYWYSEDHNYFLSIEPIMNSFSKIHLEANRIIGAPLFPKWVIIGAETGNRKDKIIPKREWISAIVENCRECNVPVFLKSSLKEVWGEPLIQEYPWEKQ